MSKRQHVLLTGLPGVGKTTLVRKVVEELEKRKQYVSGFYTAEIRDPSVGKRTGFQVVTIDGQRATLSSIYSKSTIKVGNYGVELEEFEKAAIPSISKNFSSETPGSGVLVIDEIGKMELFSSKFKTAVENALSKSNTLVLATIPVPSKGKPIPFVEKIRNMPGAKLFVVDRSNRDRLLMEVINTLIGVGDGS